MALADSYQKSWWTQRRVNALYPPDGSVELGDVLEYARGTYWRRDTIERLGILPELKRPLDPP
jgi:hypothetical protein